MQQLLKQTSQISQLQNGIQLYTKQTNIGYGYLNVYFSIGLRNESKKQKGSLQTLFFNQQVGSELQTHYRNFQFQSQIPFNFQFNDHNCFWETLFLDDDLDISQQQLMLQIFQTQFAITDSTKQYIQKVFENQLINKILNLQSKFISTCYPQLEIDENIIQKIPTIDDFVEFQETQIVPENCIIGYVGVRNHEEIKEKISNEIEQFTKFLNRKFNQSYIQPKFQSQTIRIEDNNSRDIEIALLFPGAELYNLTNLAIDSVLSEILGISEYGFIKGEIGMNVRSRCYNKVLQWNPYIHDAGAITKSLFDCGIFGIYMRGSYTEKQKIYEIIVGEIQKLSKISDYEIERAKNICLTKYYRKHERQHEVLKEEIMHYANNKKQFIIQDYGKAISQLTRQNIEKRVNEIKNSNKLTTAYAGKGTNNMPDYQLTSMSMKY